MTRTITEALDRFQLVKGSKGDGDKTACLASLWNWVYGEDEWSDAFTCAHPIIRSLAISLNDDDDVPLEDMKAVALLGESGAIDTWWVPTEVVLYLPAGFEYAEGKGIYEVKS
jgi:hypothetical protein